MQGTVLAVSVADGEEVEPGRVICIVEAMKMENEVHAHRAGLVSGLSVEPGQPVSTRPGRLPDRRRRVIRFAAACVEPGMARFATIFAIAALAVALAGCGGGSKAPTTTTTGSSTNPATSFSVADVSGFGKVVIDAKGRTVYILTSSGKKNVPCTDANGCTAVWPDLPLPSGTSAANAGVGLNASSSAR